MKQILRWGWLGVMLLGLGVLLAFSLPARHVVEEVPIAGPAGGDVPSLDVQVDYPMILRSGDLDRFQLQVSQVGKPEVDAEMLSARLELPELVGEQAEIVEPLRSGGHVNFEWDVRGRDPGRSVGKVWLTLMSSPDASGNVLLAKPVELDVIMPAGLPAWIWRTLGAVIGIAGLLWKGLSTGLGGGKNRIAGG